VDVVVKRGFTGKWKTYFINGVVAGEADCASGNVTHVETYFDNGQLQSSSDVVNGNPDGVAVTFFRDGKKATDGRYAAGKRVGPWVEYHPNGKPYLEATYVDGQVEGIELLRHEDGSLSARIDYHAGVETGQAGWNENGKLEYARGTTALDAGK
jgi:antitoxin component YwqK of YwqJK toxin-antitoxin module